MSDFIEHVAGAPVETGTDFRRVKHLIPYVTAHTHHGYGHDGASRSVSHTHEALGWPSDTPHEHPHEFQVIYRDQVGFWPLVVVFS